MGRTAIELVDHFLMVAAAVVEAFGSEEEAGMLVGTFDSVECVVIGMTEVVTEGMVIGYFCEWAVIDSDERAVVVELPA